MRTKKVLRKLSRRVSRCSSFHLLGAIPYCVCLPQSRLGASHLRIVTTFFPWITQSILLADEEEAPFSYLFANTASSASSSMATAVWKFRCSSQFCVMERRLTLSLVNRHNFFNYENYIFSLIIIIIIWEVACGSYVFIFKIFPQVLIHNYSCIHFGFQFSHIPWPYWNCFRNVSPLIICVWSGSIKLCVRL